MQDTQSRKLRERFEYLFLSTKGLALVAIAMISLVSGIFGMLSGPMAEWGISDIVIRVLGMYLVPADREGRIIAHNDRNLVGKFHQEPQGMEILESQETQIVRFGTHTEQYELTYDIVSSEIMDAQTGLPIRGVIGTVKLGLSAERINACVSEQRLENIVIALIAIFLGLKSL